ncbi:T9SS type A sorting domain-containing protein, partial [Tamlana sp. 2201CG12-4]|uniref:T9SS type A sorting domain-containing protein n=1 Tax=Tamlana sp. 2201CG12-4 TaxID=3112582 RepID=UPI002DB7481F
GEVGAQWFRGEQIKISKELSPMFTGPQVVEIANTTGLLGDDLIYHEDGRFVNNSGYTLTLESGTMNNDTNSTVVADDTEAGYTRPATNFPSGTTADYSKSVRLQSSLSGANQEGTLWVVANSVNLSEYDGAGGSKYLYLLTLTKNFRNGGNNMDDQNVLMYRNSNTGDDPRTGPAWAEVPSGLISTVGSTAAFGTDNAFSLIQVDLSGINCGTNFAMAVKRTTSADGPNPGETAYSNSTNRNGNLWLASQIYTGIKAALSVEDNLSKRMSIYPNPVKHTLNIINLNADSRIKHVSIFDITGKSVYSNGYTKSIDMSGFSRGLYILRLESEEGATLLVNKIVLK